MNGHTLYVRRGLMGLVLICLFVASPISSWTQESPPVQDLAPQNEPAPAEELQIFEERAPELALPEQEPVAEEVLQEVPAVEDEAIGRRLRSIFAQIRSLENVTVAVHSGVVRLSGKVSSGEAKTRAVELAESIPGVIYVDNQITEAVDVADRVSPTWERIQEFALDFVRRMPLFLLAIFIVALFWYVSKLLVLWDWPFKQLTKNVLARGLLKQFLRVIIVIGGLLIALDLLDATTVVGAILGTAGVVGLALGFAFRDIAENYLASILLSMRRPFEANDLVEIESFTGRIVRLTMRETILMTTDGNHVRIANATVFKSSITNFSRNPRRRFDFEVGVGNEEDLARVLTLGVTTLKEMEGVMEDPAPIGRVQKLADSSVTLWFAGWVDQERASFGKVKSEAIRRIKEAFDGADVDMPSPIYIVEMTEALPQHKPDRRLAKASETPTNAALEVTDIGVEDELEKQIEEERKHSTEEDLLRG